MTVLTIFTTFVEKNYIMFAVQKDEAGVVSLLNTFVQFFDTCMNIIWNCVNVYL